MKTRSVDIAIIGAGTAGLNAVREAEKAGKRWLLIEQGPYGTTCARVGCMPSKLLIAAADAAHHARRAHIFGVRVGEPDIDGSAVMYRLRQERDRFASAVVDDTEGLPTGNRLRGQACFVDANTLMVTPVPEADGETVRVRTVTTVIATGSRPFVPPPLSRGGPHVVTTEDVFELDALPRSLGVVGTGPVGLEIGQAMARLGVDVTFIDRAKHPGPTTDPEVTACVGQVLGAGLTLCMESEVTDARARTEGLELHWTCADNSTHAALFERVLVAAGRPPELAGLDLAATGLTLDDDGMPPWNPETTQCGDAPIFLAGDANGQRRLLHEAGDEGRISGENAARWPDIRSQSRRTPLAIVFCDPQIAMIGRTFRELEAGAAAIGQASFENQGRARVLARNQGLIRVYGRRADCVLLGAELFGPDVEHLAHLLAWGIQQEVTVQQLLQMPVYHPTLEEGMRSALRDLARTLGVDGECRRQDLSESPGM